MLSTRCAELRDAGTTIKGPEHIELGDQCTQFWHDAIGAAGRQEKLTIYKVRTPSNRNGS